MGTDPLLAIHGMKLSASDKGLPLRAIGMTVANFLASKPKLSEFWTPLLVLDQQSITHNIDTLARWSETRGFELMPHGKTTMSPPLWAQQLAAGATGITLATMGQVRTAVSFGFKSLFLANEVTDPLAIRYIASELNKSDIEFTCWVDSLTGIAAMEDALTEVELRRPINVCVDLGAKHGRTGARTVSEGVSIGRRLAKASKLRLAGVGGYEGALAHDRSTAGMAAVRDFLRSQLALHDALKEFYDGDPVIVTAGGSAYFDVVAEEFSTEMARNTHTRWVLRSGAYITHDDGFYQGISPLAASGTKETLHAAMHGMARIVSNPDPGLALLDGGKRDFPFDEGLPLPMGWATQLGATITPLAGAIVTAMNDQHTYMKFDPSARLALGTIVTLGLSHPCTAFDKWRFIPVVANAGSDQVIDLIPTFF